MTPKGRRVLIADDNEEFAAVLQLALEADGYEVEVASNGRAALEAQRRHPADILITDLVMPERDGFETLTSFRAEFPKTKVVVISGQGRLHAPRYLFAAELMGADAVLQKPFDVAQLLQILKDLAPSAP